MIADNCERCLTLRKGRKSVDVCKRAKLAAIAFLVGMTLATPFDEAVGGQTRKLEIFDSMWTGTSELSGQLKGCQMAQKSICVKQAFLLFWDWFFGFSKDLNRCSTSIKLGERNSCSTLIKQLPTTRTARTGGEDYGWEHR